MSKIFSLISVYEMLLKNLTPFLPFFLYCFDILFNSSSLLFFFSSNQNGCILAPW